MVDKNIQFVKNDFKTPMTGVEYKVLQSGQMIAHGTTDGKGHIRPVGMLIPSKKLITVYMKFPDKQEFIKTHEFYWSNAWPLSIRLAYPGKYSSKIQTQVSTGDPAKQHEYTQNIHVVVAGDVLSKIAIKYGTTVSALVSLNNIKEAHTIAVGQKIKLPPRHEKVKDNNTTAPITGEAQETSSAVQKQQNSEKKGSPVVVALAKGTWNIKVTAPDDRTKVVNANLFDENGVVVFSFPVLLRGSAKNRENRLLTNANTPLGTYSIPKKDKWLSGNRGPYGNNPRLVLNGASGEIVTSKRSLIRIHGGRQEDWIKPTTQKNADGTTSKVAGYWKAHNTPQLKPTNGCLRAWDANMITLKKHIDTMEKRGVVSGKLIITDSNGNLE